MTLTLTRSDTAARWAEADLSAETMADLGWQVQVIDSAGTVLPHQLDRVGEGAELVVDTAGAADGALTVQAGQADVTAQIGVDTVQDYEGQETLRIQTQAATWYYHKFGGGFASIIDGDGKDWLSFRPWGGSDGIYRGIPNMAYPDNVFHPGHFNCTTTAPVTGPLRTTFETWSKDEAWGARWRVYPDHAEMTVLAVGHSYWLLYEGTPHGKLEEERDFCILSTGEKRPLTEEWDEVLPEPKWITFGKDGVGHGLWLWSHADGNADCRDSFYPMEGNMTVFGFGRKRMNIYMEAVPARFTFGMCAVEGDLAGRIHTAGERDRLKVD